MLIFFSPLITFSFAHSFAQFFPPSIFFNGVEFLWMEVKHWALVCWRCLKEKKMFNIQLCVPLHDVHVKVIKFMHLWFIHKSIMLWIEISGRKNLFFSCERWIKSFAENIPAAEHIEWTNRDSNILYAFVSVCKIKVNRTQFSSPFEWGVYSHFIDKRCWMKIEKDYRKKMFKVARYMLHDHFA